MKLLAAKKKDQQRQPFFPSGFDEPVVEQLPNDLFDVVHRDHDHFLFCHVVEHPGTFVLDDAQTEL